MKTEVPPSINFHLWVEGLGWPSTNHGQQRQPHWPNASRLQRVAGSLTEATCTKITPSPEAAISLCVASCSTTSMSYNTAQTVARAMKSVAAVRTVILSETHATSGGDVEIMLVPQGTKLSKIGRLSDLVDADLFCICDPDITIEEEACRTVLKRAVAGIRAGREVVAFGIVDGSDNGTLLSQVIAVDKWLSHHILRPSLWTAGIGLTLPGQFLILSPGVLRSIDPSVDSYLDDVYLGWIARERHARVYRVPVVVGSEDPRNSWMSLLFQRIRWLKGLTRLGWLLSGNPRAVGLLSTHYLVYYGLPMLIGLGLWWLAIEHPPVAVVLFLLLTAVLRTVTRQSLLTAACWLLVFPCLHLFVSLLWWLPLGKSLLRR